MIFKKLKKNKNKPSGKKRKLLTTIALILSLLFGKPRLSPSVPSKAHCSIQNKFSINEKVNVSDYV